MTGHDGVEAAVAACKWGPVTAAHRDGKPYLLMWKRQRASGELALDIRVGWWGRHPDASSDEYPKLWWTQFSNQIISGFDPDRVAPLPPEDAE